MGFGKRWPVPGKKEAKFKSEIIEIEGEKFRSKTEAERYGQLRLAEREGAITDLKREVTFELEVNGFLITKYRADYTYRRNGELVVEDRKGMVTPEFKLKFKLMKACLGITVYCTDHRNREVDPLKPRPAKKKKKLDPGEAPKGNLRMSSKTKQTTLKF